MKLSDLSDAPLSDLPQSDPKVVDFAEELNDLLDDPRFGFAYDTLAGIRETIQRNQHVTPGQYLAVKNIRQSVEERESRPKWGRRYEGR